MALRAARGRALRAARVAFAPAASASIGNAASIPSSRLVVGASASRAWRADAAGLHRRAFHHGSVVSRGAIAVDDAQRLIAQLDAAEPPVETLILQSPGGSVPDALELGRHLRAREAVRGVPHTRVF